MTEWLGLEGECMDLNTAWKKTCKTVLGEEIGELDSYKEYLSHFNEPVALVKSGIGGKEVAVSIEGICEGAKFLGYSELGEYAKRFASEVSINDMKDLDSLADKFSEIAYYCGDIVLGNSKWFENCDMCASIFFTKESHHVTDSKYIAYSYMIRHGENLYGCGIFGDGSTSIRSLYGYKPVRCFECHRMIVSSDCYFSANLDGCNNCIFSFGLRNKSYCIGNAPLPKEKYLKLKGKLLEDVRAELASKKSVLGILDLLSANGMAEWNPKKFNIKRGIEKAPYFDTKAVPVPSHMEKAFQTTTQVLLGKPLVGLAGYEKWLLRHVRVPEKSVSAASGKPLYLVPLTFSAMMDKRSLSLEESMEWGTKSISEIEAESLNLKNAVSVLDKIRYSTTEIKDGDNRDIKEAVNYGNSASCYYGSMFWTAKYCAYDFWVRYAEYEFGCDLVFYSSFCINCYSSTYLTRCFEVAASLNCSDCYFCYNCEGLRDCMFCFNVKAKRYAIGNVELGKEKYMEVKKMLLSEIGKQLEKSHDCQIDIYNLGAIGKKK